MTLTLNTHIPSFSQLVVKWGWRGTKTHSCVKVQVNPHFRNYQTTEELIERVGLNSLQNYYKKQ